MTVSYFVGVLAGCWFIVNFSRKNKWIKGLDFTSDLVQCKWNSVQGYLTKEHYTGTIEPRVLRRQQSLMGELSSLHTQEDSILQCNCSKPPTCMIANPSESKLYTENNFWQNVDVLSQVVWGIDLDSMSWLILKMSRTAECYKAWQDRIGNKENEILL